MMKQDKPGIPHFDWMPIPFKPTEPDIPGWQSLSGPGVPPTPPLFGRPFPS